MSRRWQVAHIGTGRTGRVLLKRVLATPGLELVGCYVHSPPKVGRDAGELVDQTPVGVIATNDFDAILSVDADCVVYAATAAGREMDEVVDQLCMILSSGKNVVTIVGELIHPPALDSASRAKLQSACASGKVALVATGIAPGFATDVLPVHLATLSNSISKITVSERILCGSYSVSGFFAALGFGTTPEVDATAYRPGTGVAMFGNAIQLMAHGLGWHLDDFRESKDVAVAASDFSCAAGDVAAGTILGVRFTVEGVVNGDPRLHISEIWSLTDDLVDEWEPRPTVNGPPRMTRITIGGTPTITADLALDGSPLPGVDATAARVVNAIPAVCAARPGVYGGLDLAIQPTLSAAP